jgi:hypothetical protein
MHDMRQTVAMTALFTDADAAAGASSTATDVRSSAATDLLATGCAVLVEV